MTTLLQRRPSLDSAKLPEENFLKMVISNAVLAGVVALSMFYCVEGWSSGSTQLMKADQVEVTTVGCTAV